MKTKSTILLWVLMVSMMMLLFANGCKKTEDEDPYNWETGTMTDVEGNVYKTIKIGSQWWMAENLKSRKYRDGKPVPFLNDYKNWEVAGYTLKTPCYGYYHPGDTIAYRNTYGLLYNWYALNTGKLAPEEWHVPTLAEFDTLVKYLGGWNVAGGKMKSTSLWQSPNYGASNSSGFTGLPGGSSAGTSFGLGMSGCWFTTSEMDTVRAFLMSLEWRSGVVGYYQLHKGQGCSIRCIRD